LIAFFGSHRKHFLDFLFKGPFLYVVDGVIGGPGGDADGDDVHVGDGDGAVGSIDVHQGQRAPHALTPVLQLHQSVQDALLHIRI
ncbi:MAG: hypothetical protein ACPH2J_10885, partial [Akkermansiaceae bacterium]